MQHYSQTLDLDMLNQRYWQRRMQQCKAEFKANPSHTPMSNPATTSDYKSRSFSRTPPSSEAQAHPAANLFNPQTHSDPAKLQPTDSSKDRSHPAPPKLARAIKYHVR